MSLNALPPSLRSELARHCPEARRSAVVMVTMEPRDPGREPWTGVSGLVMRNESGGCRFWPFLFNSGLPLGKMMLVGREFGAVLGLSTLSSRHRGTPGAGAGCSSSEAVSKDDRDWLKPERPLGMVSMKAGPLLVTEYSPVQCKRRSLGLPSHGSCSPRGGRDPAVADS